MYQFRQLPQNLLVVEPPSNPPGPKEKLFFLKPSEEEWPEKPADEEKRFIVPDVPPISEGAPKIAELVKTLPGSVTIRQMKSTQPQIEQKLVHVTLDGTVTGVTLGQGSTLHPCAPEDHQWFRLETVNNDSSELVISAENKELHPYVSNCSKLGTSNCGMAVLELNNSSIPTSGVTDCKRADVTSDPPMEISIINDVSSEYVITSTETVEFVRKNRGLLSVSHALSCSEVNDKGRKIVRSTKTWVMELIGLLKMTSFYRCCFRFRKLEAR